MSSRADRPAGRVHEGRRPAGVHHGERRIVRHDRPRELDGVREVRDRVAHRHEQDEAGDERDPDGVEDALRGGDVGLDRLLGDVGRGVVAGERVLRVQQAEQRHVDGHREPREPRERVPPLAAEHERERVVVRPFAGAQTRTDTMTATPMRCHQTEMSFRRATRRMLKVFNRPCSARTTKRTAEDVPRRQPVRLVGELGEEGREREGAAEADAGRDGDLPQQVEPAGEPRPPGPALAGRQLGRPVVEAAGRRVRRADLGHREADEADDEADAQPAPVDDRRAAVLQAERVDGQAARQDRDDGERDREVGEAAHAAVELLGVAHLVELARVFVEDWRPPCRPPADRWCGHVVCHRDPQCSAWPNLSALPSSSAPMMSRPFDWPATHNTPQGRPTSPTTAQLESARRVL